MTDVLTAAAAHFDRMRGQSVEVPEWGAEGVPLVVRFDPLTLRQRQALQGVAKGNESRMMALCVIRHARQADGAAMFKDDAPTLAQFENQIDPKVVARIAAAILGLGDLDALKN